MGMEDCSCSTRFCCCGGDGVGTPVCLPTDHALSDCDGTTRSTGSLDEIGDGGNATTSAVVLVSPTDMMER